MALKDMQTNIQHVVHLMLENRGFDHVLGWLWNNTANKPKVNIPPLRPGEAPFYGLPQDSSGSPTLWFPADPSFYQSGPYTGPQKVVNKGLWGYCLMPVADPGEGWDDVTQQIYGPNSQMNLPTDKLMRGFYLNYVNHKIGFGSNDDILATGTPTDLPVINGLAAAYAVSDTWFASAPTETNPNRAFSLGGSSEGRQNNCSFDGVPYADLRTIFGVLNDTNNSWKIYADHYWMEWQELYFTEYMFPQGVPQDSSDPHFGTISDFASDVMAGTLPVFSYLEPTFQGEAGTPNDYHPPGSVYDGETFLLRVYNALTANPVVFGNTLLIVTFDEHGGTLDHVVPPSAVPPDQDPTFGRYGVRVPTILISPWVPPGCVFRAGYFPMDGHPEGNGGMPFDHTSVLATLCKWLNIPYQKSSDIGWLRSRTASAPTFENVITSTRNKNIATVGPAYNCSDTLVAASPYGLAPAQMQVLLMRLTGFHVGDPRLNALMAKVKSTCRSREDFNKLFQQLRRQYGSVRHSGA